MFIKPVIMKCGHRADTVMTNVPYYGEKISVGACSFCFDQLGTAIQPACSVDRILDPTPLPSIKRDYYLPICCLVACLVILIILIASIKP